MRSLADPYVVLVIMKLEAETKSKPQTLRPKNLKQSPNPVLKPQGQNPKPYLKPYTTYLVGFCRETSREGPSGIPRCTASKPAQKAAGRQPSPRTCSWAEGFGFRVYRV